MTWKKLGSLPVIKADRSPSAFFRAYALSTILASTCNVHLWQECWNTALNSILSSFSYLLLLKFHSFYFYAGCCMVFSGKFSTYSFSQNFSFLDRLHWNQEMEMGLEIDCLEKSTFWRKLFASLFLNWEF